jgi:hypothetical protein
MDHLLVVGGQPDPLAVGAEGEVVDGEVRHEPAGEPRTERIRAVGDRDRLGALSERDPDAAAVRAHREMMST